MKRMIWRMSIWIVGVEDDVEGGAEYGVEDRVEDGLEDAWRLSIWMSI